MTARMIEASAVIVVAVDIQRRRSFMADALGIEPHEDVLPFSNIPAYLPPFLLRPDQAMTLGA